MLAKKLTDVCEGRAEADLKFTNCRIVDVYNKCTFSACLSICDGYIASFSDEVKAKKTIDARGRYLVPGLIDAHCHIESSHLSPASFNDLVVPKGTTTVIADPHEICNVAGLEGMRYMLDASKDLDLSVFFMFPSCVPATESEHAGAVLEAKDIDTMMDEDRILGLGEMMNYPGIAAGLPFVFDKLECAYRTGKFIDGHAPMVEGKDLDAYAACRIISDHEGSSEKELIERVRRGMYVALREGTACRNVLQLVGAVNADNLSRVMFCTDDCQSESIVSLGHINHAVNLAIESGMKSEAAISAATLNPAVCYNLRDRGAIAPGLRADFFFTSSLENIEAEEVYILGSLAAKDGAIIRKAEHYSSEKVLAMMNVKDFDTSRLTLRLKSDKARVKATGNVGLGLIKGYGIRHGAIATSISHDSHNIIAAGTNDTDMGIAVNELIRTGGGVTIVRDGKVLMTHPLEIAGLMTDANASEVCSTLAQMHSIAWDELGVSRDIDPFMTLSFMALPVIPKLKITDSGLFDVVSFSFTDINPQS